MRPEKPSIKALRRLLVEDSIERARWMTKLLQLVREEAASDTLRSLGDVRDQRTARGATE